MLRPKEVAGAISRLRGGTLLTLDRLSDDQLERQALPGWTVADVFRHLADSDRATLRREPEVWGRRLARTVRLLPGPLARVVVPTSFWHVPLGWLAGLRLYDEWVHRWDVAQVIDDPEPPMDLPLRDLLAEFQLRALPAWALDDVEADGVVEVQVTEGLVWRFDLGRHRFGAHLRAAPTATVRLDVPAFCLVAANRVPWRALAGQGRIDLVDDDRGSGTSVLDACRVV